VEGLHQSGRGLSELSEISRWRLTPRPAIIPCVAMHIVLPSQCHHLFSLYWSPISNEHCVIVANCDHTSERVHWVRACIGISMQWVTLQKPLLALLLPVRNMQFSHYELYTSFQVARCMWLLTIHHSFCLSPALQLSAISGITCAQPMMFPTVKTCKATAGGAFLTWTNFETGSKLPYFSGIVVSTRADQYSMKAASSFRSWMFNSRCSCDGRWPLSAP